MSIGYRTVQWNVHKRIYDAVLVGCMLLYLRFMLIGTLTHPVPREISTPVLAIRALGTLGIVMLHVILAIGPLARLDDRFTPLLYNRRHFGVAFFLVALAHALLSTLFYGGFGAMHPAMAMLAGYGQFDSISAFPFEVIGFLALLVFFIMAATSHDFWLHNLNPRVWKWIHVSVYPAYWLVVFHVALGTLQSEPSLVYPGLLLAGATMLVALHGLAARKEQRTDAACGGEPQRDGAWMDVCAAEEITDGAARIVCPVRGERIAVFRHGDRLSAVASVCAHQGGPLGEGRVIDGCITCPWHGYQYLPESGRSPPPFSEKIPTYEVRIAAGRVQVKAEANPAGTRVEPAIVAPRTGATEEAAP